MCVQIYTWCSGVHGELSLTWLMCNPCDSTIQEVDLTEDLVVDGETFGYVKIYVMLSGRHS